MALAWVDVDLSDLADRGKHFAEGVGLLLGMFAGVVRMGEKLGAFHAAAFDDAIADGVR